MAKPNSANESARKQGAGKLLLQAMVGLIPYAGPLLLALWVLHDSAREMEQERAEDAAIRAQMFILQQPGGAEFLHQMLR